jgi:hypothetical protein
MKPKELGKCKGRTCKGRKLETVQLSLELL